MPKKKKTLGIQRGGGGGGIECRSLLKSSKKRQNQTVRKDNERNSKYEFLLILVCVYIYGHKFFPQIFLFMHLFQIFFESHLYQWMHKFIVTDTCMNIPCTDLIDWGGIQPSTVQGMGYTCTQYLLHTLN